MFFDFCFWMLHTVLQILTIAPHALQGTRQALEEYMFLDTMSTIVPYFNLESIPSDPLLPCRAKHVSLRCHNTPAAAPGFSFTTGTAGAEEVAPIHWHASQVTHSYNLPWVYIYNYHQVCLLMIFPCWSERWVSWVLFIPSHHHHHHLGLAQQTLMRLFAALVSGSRGPEGKEVRRASSSLWPLPETAS